MVKPDDSKQPKEAKRQRFVWLKTEQTALPSPSLLQPSSQELQACPSSQQSDMPCSPLQTHSGPWWQTYPVENTKQNEQFFKSNPIVVIRLQRRCLTYLNHPKFRKFLGELFPGACIFCCHLCQIKQSLFCIQSV